MKFWLVTSSTKYSFSRAIVVSLLERERGRCYIIETFRIAFDKSFASMRSAHAETYLVLFNMLMQFLSKQRTIRNYFWKQNNFSHSFCSSPYSIPIYSFNNFNVNLWCFCYCRYSSYTK